ncbi:hypothetical protein OHV10_21500 [Vibrio splendidus]|uniref:hypothetical protein n=1 Tax=Vibrio splendidus TaxID=29497 RepID=UPI002236220F|nr:hypothetical protein [Vibrio splendidus]MCW4446819.1 hypothetical protein [Vibrio splendidus]
MINNPQDLTPLLTAMSEGLQADMTTLVNNVQAANAALSQSVSDDIDALAVVNGEISTEVQAINTHTSSEVSKLPLSPVKVVHHIASNGGGAFTIPEVDLTKAFVIYNATNGYAKFNSSTQVIVYGVSAGYQVTVEVVEYA